MHDALDENWYSQLKHIHTAYRNMTPIQILDHLDSDGVHSTSTPKSSSSRTTAPSGMAKNTSPHLANA
jgi:hypothetical protein